MLASMLGMHFMGFVALVLISLVAALFVHYEFHYRMVEGFDGFLWKWVAGWVGAWLGSPVLGDWFSHITIGHVYVIPAFIGAFIGAFLAAFIWKAEARVLRTVKANN